MCCISPSDSEANRYGADSKSPFPLFFSFLPHLRTLAQEKWSENFLGFGTGGPSLRLYPLLSRYILFFPTLTMAAYAKKRTLAKRFAHAISVHYRDFEHAYVYWIWLRGSGSYVIISFCCVVWIHMGYWPSFFGQDGWILAEFCSCQFMDLDSASVHKYTKKELGQYPAILTEKAWSIKDLSFGLRGNFSRGPQRAVPSGQDSSIVAARVANHSARFCSSFPLTELAI